jgi:multiple sugar transport system substrate-binding protein
MNDVGDTENVEAFPRRTLLEKAAVAAGAVGVLSLSSPGASLAALSRKAGVSAAPAPTGTLTFIHEGAADLIAIINGVISLFEKRYPRVHVRSTIIPGGGTTGNWGQYFDALVTQIAGGRIPDTVWMATEGLRVFESHGLLYPIDGLIERDRKELDAYFKDLPPVVFGSWDKLASPGHRYELPTQFNTMGIWYNADLFSQAGVPEPKTGWTWDDFHAIATKLTQQGKVYGMYVTNASTFVGPMPWLVTNGASPMNGSWTKATIDTPQAIEAAEFMRQLVSEGISPAPGGQFDPFGAMAQGKLAMFGAGWWPLPTMKKLGMLKKVGIAPWPVKRAEGSPVGWNMYPIFKASHNKEAAWTLAKYMTSVEAMTYIGTRGITLPLRRSIVGHALKQGPKGGINLYRVLEHATPTPSPNKAAVIQTDIEDTFGQILTGNVKAADALPALNKRIQANV